MWLTNGGSSNLVAVLVKTTRAPRVSTATSRRSSSRTSGFGEVRPGLTIPGKIDKMGYKGVDTTELVMDGLELHASHVLGGETGRGFYQMMVVEVGRVNEAARACGLANSNSESTTHSSVRPSASRSLSTRQ